MYFKSAKQFLILPVLQVQSQTEHSEVNFHSLWISCSLISNFHHTFLN